MKDSKAAIQSGDSSYESALEALFSPGVHQATTKEDIARSARRRTRTVSDMRYYWKKILQVHPDYQETQPLQKKPLLIHVTGTKGKGSTACMCEAILRGHGYSTGLFTSPHLIDIRERIRWNGKPIHPTIFANVYWKIRRALESDPEGENDSNDEDPPPKLPGYFRMLTLMGMYTFLRELAGGIDAIILEVGMGGRYDATNFLDVSSEHFRRVANGVTLLDLDHTRILGDTLEEIAWEKGGIFAVNKLNPDGISERPHGNKPEILETAEPAGTESKKRKLSKGSLLSPRNILLDSNTQGVIDMMKSCCLVEGKGGELCLVDATGSKIKELLRNKGLTLGLAGSHQFGNATLAAALCRSAVGKNEGTNSIEIDSPTTLGALASAKWPGRCQTFEWSNKNKDTILSFCLDGAHTPQSLEATVDWLRSKRSCSASDNASMTDLPILVFNCSHERNPVELLELFLKHDQLQFFRVYFAKSDSSRPSPVAKASAESLLEERGIPVRGDLLLGDKENRTWQETLAIVWKHLTAKESPAESSTSGIDSIHCNMTASQVVREIQEISAGINNSNPTQVFVTGSLYLVGSFLTALEWSEESSSPL